MLADVREPLCLFRRIVDGEGAVGTGQGQPCRHQLRDMGEMLLERGEARVVPVHIIPDECSRTGRRGRHRSGPLEACLCQMFGKPLPGPLQAPRRAVGNGFGLWGNEVMHGRQGPERWQS